MGKAHLATLTRYEASNCYPTISFHMCVVLWEWLAVARYPDLVGFMAHADVLRPDVTEMVLDVIERSEWEEKPQSVQFGSEATP